MKELNQEELATNAKTWDHIEVVMRLLASAQIELMRRQFTHDRSKLGSPEVETFVEFTPKLKGSTYGSEEYRGFLAAMKPALDHHYAHNRHHPEFFEAVHNDPENMESMGIMVEHLYKIATGESHLYPDDGYGVDSVIRALNRRKAENTAPINGMNLFDLLEMFIDWCAACQRHADGDINKSIEINRDRFLLSPQLVQIFKNTAPWVGDEFRGLLTQRELTPEGADWRPDQSQVPS